MIIFIVFFPENQKTRNNIKRFNNKNPYNITSKTKLISYIEKIIVKNDLYSKYEEENFRSPLKAIYQEKTYQRFLSEIVLLVISFIFILVFVIFISPILFTVLLSIFITIIIKKYKEPIVSYRKRIKKIENELTKLTEFFVLSFKNGRDIYGILNSFKEGTISELKNEIEITLADIRSSNVKNSLLNLENRIYSKNLRELTRTLISIDQGDNDLSYLTMLSFEFSKEHINNLKLESLKRPKKFTKFSMLLLFSFIATYFVIFGIYIFKMTKTLF